MKVRIEIEADQEQEGLMYDLDRAKDEGINEEWRMFTTSGVMPDGMKIETHEFPLDEDDVALLQKLFFDIGANTFAGDINTLNITVKYRYGYGEALLPEEAHPSATVA